MRKVLFIFGTRPEAIKLCPLVQACRQQGGFQTRVCVTAQHRALLDQVLRIFAVRPDHDLNVMMPGQTLAAMSARILEGLETILAAERPDLVVVQGDTTTTFCGALASFYAGIPVGHVEAGLRTGDLKAPFPEEMNRVLTSRLAAIHFAATNWAAENLRREGVDAKTIAVTGNPGIDAIQFVAGRLASGQLSAPAWPWLKPDRRMILVTAHRRESFGAGFERICAALASLSEREDVQVVYPVHPNPNVARVVRERLQACDRITLIEPQPYVPFVDLMRRAELILTDSGGVQEEAPALGKPVLVLRDNTERPEGVEAGTVRLVGTDAERIVREAARLLDDPSEAAAMSRVHNPYGDGRSGPLIAKLIDSFLAGN